MPVTKTDASELLPKWTRYTCLVPLAFFLGMFLHTGFCIRPTLIYHAFARFIPYPEFRTTGAFFTECLSRPGGFLEYTHGFLSQWFYYAWAGAVILTVLAWGMNIFDSENANQIKQSGGTLKGYLPFKSSNEPMTLSAGWDKIDASVPASPPLVAVNQSSGEVLSSEAFAKRALQDQLPVCEDTLSRLRSSSLSIQAARTLAGDINISLLQG